MLDHLQAQGHSRSSSSLTNLCLFQRDCPPCPPTHLLASLAVPGSTQLRIGLASGGAPLVLPHCVAWRRGAPAVSPNAASVIAPAATPVLVSAVAPAVAPCAVPSATTTAATVAVPISVPIDAPIAATAAVPVEASMPQLARAVRLGKALLGVDYPTMPPRLEQLMPAAAEAAPLDDERTLVGERALLASRLRPDEWELFWPLRRARLASLCPSTYCGLPLHTEPAPIASRVRDALALIWTAAICGGGGLRGLGISTATLRRSCAVLVLPDLFPRREAAEMLELLFSTLCFKAVLCHEEATCACVGAGVPSACVVDIGAQRTSVVCIDELMPMPGCHQVRAAPPSSQLLGPTPSAPRP